jgi:hypothetical protein
MENGRASGSVMLIDRRGFLEKGSEVVCEQ